jgi:hypothetical protein
MIVTEMTSETPDRDAVRERLGDFRKHLQSCEADGWDHFDDVVFKISAGGLALSVTLLGVTKDVRSASMPWVYAAWVLWGLTLLVMMISVLSAQSGLRSQITHVDAGDYYQHAHPEGHWGSFTPWLNRAAATLCGVALCCLIVFAFTNASRSSVMSKENGGLKDLGRVAPQAPRNQAITSGDLSQRGQVTPQAPAQVPTTVAPGSSHPGAGQVAPQAPPPPPGRGKS